MDSPTRRALYANIRRQIAHNMDLANKNHERAICRYCKIKTGPLNEYVAFVIFSETAEFAMDTEASQDEKVTTATLDAERNVDLGKTGSEDRGSGKEVSKVVIDDYAEIKNLGREVLGEIKQRKSDKKLKRVPRVTGRKLRNIETSAPELTQKSNVGEKLAGERASVDVEVCKVVSEVTRQKTDVEPGKEGEVISGVTRQKTDVEPDDEPNIVSKPEELMSDAVQPAGIGTAGKPGAIGDVALVREEEHEAQPDVVNEHDIPEDSTDEVVTGTVSSLERDHEAETEAVTQVTDSAGVDSDQPLYEWKADTVLQVKSDVISDDADLKNVEYRRLSDWLSSRTDATTTIHRFPMLYNLPVLGLRENPERSVTWHLAEKFEPWKRRPEHPGLAVRNDTADKNKKTASDVVFIGPYDTSVIKQAEVVRRRVRQICEDMLPQALSDVLCVTDVGSDVGLTRVSDIVNVSELSADQFCAYTAMDTASSSVSCVLLRFSPSMA